VGSVHYFKYTYFLLKLLDARLSSVKISKAEHWTRPGFDNGVEFEILKVMIRKLVTYYDNYVPHIFFNDLCTISKFLHMNAIFLSLK